MRTGVAMSIQPLRTDKHPTKESLDNEIENKQ